MTALAIGSFDAAAPFQEAIRRARAGDRHIAGLWSPIPVEVPGAPAAGQRHVAATMALTGLAGAGFLYLLIWWSAVHSYPIVSGGRPLNSWPAFLIAPVEFGALAAGIGGMIAFFVRAHLTRLHDAAFELDEVEAAQRDRFVIAIRCDEGEDGNAAIALLAEAGAVHSRLLAP